MPALSKEFLGIHVTIQCEFTLKGVRAIIRTYGQMQSRDQYSQESLVILTLAVLQNG